MHLRLMTHTNKREVADLFRASPSYAAARDVLMKLRKRTLGRQWFRTVHTTPLTTTYWTRGRQSNRTTDIQARQIAQLTKLSELKFPDGLKADGHKELVARTWDLFRDTLSVHFGYNMRVGATAEDILRAAEHASQNPTTGCPRVESYIRTVLGDPTLLVSPMLACDVLMLLCDTRFSKGVDGFSRDASSMLWGRLLSRPTGSDLVELARDLTSAYVQKIDDNSITVANVCDYPSHMHDICVRFAQVLRHDEANPARGKDVAVVFEQELAERKSAVDAGVMPQTALSIIDICELKLNPYEESHAQLHTTALEALRVNAAMPPAYTPLTSTHTPPTHASPPVPPAPPVPPGPPVPPVPTDASYALLGTSAPRGLTNTNGARARPAARPSHGNGLPKYAKTQPTDVWTEAFWGRVRTNPQRMHSLICNDGKTLYKDNPALLAAWAKVFPTDASMTIPNLTKPESVSGYWGPGSCAYCTFRPRAPPGTAADQQWRYGTGDGAHSPIICQNLARFICEGCCGEVDERAVPMFYNLISLKRLEGQGPGGRK